MIERDWRADRLDRIRALVAAALPAAVEEVKWRKPTNPDGVPTWSQDGLICTGERYKDKVKLTFAHGAALPDPAGLFVPQQGGTRRAIDLREHDRLDEAAFQDLLRAAAARNAAHRTKR